MMLMAALNIDQSDLAAREAPVEQAVTTYISAMPFIWIDIDDEPGPASAGAASFWLLVRNLRVLKQSPKAHKI
jgi:hypothetical protein